MALGQSDEKTFARQVRITIVDAASESESLDARIASLFSSTTSVEVHRTAQLTKGEVISPTETKTLRLWIVLKADGHARIYVVVPSARQDAARYLFRDIMLETGLDEVGQELLSHVVHSSAIALLNRKQETPMHQLEQELTQDTVPVEQPLWQPRPNSFAPTPQQTPERGGSAQVKLTSPRQFLVRSTPATSVWLGADFGGHATGQEGWGFESGACIAVERQWSLRVRGALLPEHRFDATPATIDARGWAVEGRAGWLWVVDEAIPLRLRPELGLGTLFVSWSANATLPAIANAGETNRRDYGLVSLGVLGALGPVGLGIRGELRVPFKLLSYDVDYSGKLVRAASSWLSPGVAFELAIPLTRRPAQNTR